MGLTIKQEAFCQKYIETGNASEAYRQSYNAGNMKPETVNRTAKELLDNPKISARVAELRVGVQTAHSVTVASLIAELEEARMVGKGKDQASAMVAATMGKAKLAGLDKDAGSPTDDLPHVLSELIAKLPG